MTSGESHCADLVARVRLYGEDACLLVHVESQAQPVAEFERRMFRYFARLHEAYGVPVIPIALLSDRAVGRKTGRDRYVVAGPHRPVLTFHFHLIELKRYAWRDFLRSENPVASALMSRMKIARKDRPLVKSACLRLIAGMSLDPARKRLLTGFVDTYLRLDEKETEQFMLEINSCGPLEAQTMMELTTSWKEEGRREGLQEGLSLALQARFGETGGALASRLGSVDAKVLNRLKARVLTASLAELEKLLK